jgi:hypothetical protein
MALAVIVAILLVTIVVVAVEMVMVAVEGIAAPLVFHKKNNNTFHFGLYLYTEFQN